VSGAVISYIEDAIAVAFSLVAGSEILAALKKFLGLSAPLS
jgi:hypothetical protein